jgi:VWFA-related protein
MLRLSLLSFALILLPLVFASTAERAQETSASQTPIIIAILFDTSQSTSLQNEYTLVKPKDLKMVLTPLFQLNSQNQYFIINVNTSPKVILDGSADSEQALKALSKLASLSRGGATALYDACYIAIRKVTRTEPSKRVLIVVSDGMDTISSKSFNEVKRALIDRNVQLYAIISQTRESRSEEGSRALDELASVSGGESFYPKGSQDLKAIMEKIVTLLQE